MRAELGGFCTRATVASCAPIVAAFLQHQTWQTPTLAVRHARAAIDGPLVAEDPRLAFEPRALREQWLAARDRRLVQRASAGFAPLRAQFANEQWLAGHLFRSGVPLLAGSDAGADFSYHGFGLRDELEELVQAGLTPWQAMQAATQRAAEFLGRPGATGAIAIGAEADLVLYDCDPTVDTSCLGRIRGVMTRGAWLDRRELDRMLAAVRQAAR
jgi:hypothetical protein